MNLRCSGFINSVAAVYDRRTSCNNNAGTPADQKSAESATVTDRRYNLKRGANEMRQGESMEQINAYFFAALGVGLALGKSERNWE